MVLNEPKVDATGSRRRGPRAPEHPQRLVLPEPLEDLGGGAPALRAHARGSGAAPGGRAHRSSTAPTTPTCPTTCRWRCSWRSQARRRARPKPCSSACRCARTRPSACAPATRRATRPVGHRETGPRVHPRGGPDGPSKSQAISRPSSHHSSSLTARAATLRAVASAGVWAGRAVAGLGINLALATNRRPPVGSHTSIPSRWWGCKVRGEFRRSRSSLLCQGIFAHQRPPQSGSP